jgi:nucleoside-diphosphate-sugar epimerase
MNADGLHQPVNLGNPGEFTIKQLGEQVMKICGKQSEFKFLPLPEDDPRQRQPDITTAQRVLGWSPTVPLSQGLERTVQYFRERVQVSS